MITHWQERIFDHMDEIDGIRAGSFPYVLPCELLPQIFANLPLTDRKNVRLTCRTWYDCSNRMDITKREKFVFRTGFNVKDVAECMIRSTRPLLNFEFQGLPVTELPSHAWQACGRRTQTLDFHECHWNRSTFTSIFKFCENVTSIVIHSDMPCECDPIKILCSDLLDDAIKKGIRRPKLQTLAIFNDGTQLPESVLNKIFLLFPGIKHLGVGLVSFEIPFICCPVLYLRKPPVIFRLDQSLNPETQLESLTLNSPMKGDWMETLVDRAELGLRLKKLETILIYEISMKYTLFDFLKSQRNLEVIRLGIAESNDGENKKLFFRILDCCPNLQEFRFESETEGFSLEPSELSRFVASISKLKFLSVAFDVNRNTPAPIYQDLLSKSVQLNLVSLKWNYLNTNSDLYAAFLQHCPSLQDLHLSGYCDTTLQIIFQYLVELRTLVLNDNDSSSCTDFGFTGQDIDGEKKGYSIKRLQHLKYLALQTRDFDPMEKSTLELQLPRLEYLSLNTAWYSRLSEEELDHFASHLPELRVLAVEYIWQDDDQEKTIYLCQKLVNLNRLICRENDFDGDDIDDMVNIDHIFERCPQLRYLYDDDTGMFFRDPFTNEVNRVKTRRIKFPGNVFDSELSAIT